MLAGFAVAASLLAVYAGTAAADTRTVVSSGNATIAPRPMGGGDRTVHEGVSSAGARGRRAVRQPRPQGGEEAVPEAAARRAGGGVDAGGPGEPGARPELQRPDFRDQRRANLGNQFSVEPPDQALCVGGNYVVESVNTVMRVFDKTTGAALTGVQDLNSFYGYPAQFDRTTGAQGPFITDPICYLRPRVPSLRPRRADARRGPRHR